MKSADYDNTAEELKSLQEAALAANASFTRVYAAHVHADWRPR